MVMQISTDTKYVKYMFRAFGVLLNLQNHILKLFLGYVIFINLTLISG